MVKRDLYYFIDCFFVFFVNQIMWLKLVISLGAIVLIRFLFLWVMGFEF